MIEQKFILFYSFHLTIIVQFWYENIRKISLSFHNMLCCAMSRKRHVNKTAIKRIMHSCKADLWLDFRTFFQNIAFQFFTFWCDVQTRRMVLVLSFAAAKNNVMDFGDCYIHEQRTLTFTMTNNTESSNFKFVWPDHPQLKFSPQVGHLLGGRSKDICVTFRAEQPITLKEDEIICQITGICFDPPCDVSDWDDRMKIVKWVDAARVATQQSGDRSVVGFFLKLLPFASIYFSDSLLQSSHTHFKIISCSKSCNM